MKPPTVESLAAMSAAELDAYFEMHAVTLDGGTYAIRVGGFLLVGESVSLLKARFLDNVAASRQAEKTLADKLIDAIETHVGYTPEASDESPWANLRECIEATLREAGK